LTGVKAFIAFVAAATLSSGAAAGTIRIEITQTATLEEGVLAVSVEVRNSGDEAAHSVMPSLRFREEETSGALRSALAPNETMRESFRIPAADLGEGRWPYLLLVEYTDANQYPFQALLASTFVVGNPPPAKLAVPRFDAARISDDGKFAIEVKNLSASERKVRLSVLLPEALEATEPLDEIDLDAWEQKKVSVRVANRAALVGSSYPVFVAVECDDGSVHQTLLKQGMVEIVAREEWLGPRRGLYLWFAAGAVGLLFVAMVAYRFLRR